MNKLDEEAKLLKRRPTSIWFACILCLLVGLLSAYSLAATFLSLINIDGGEINFIAIARFFLIKLCILVFCGLTVYAIKMRAWYGWYLLFGIPLALSIYIVLKIFIPEMFPQAPEFTRIKDQQEAGARLISQWISLVFLAIYASSLLKENVKLYFKNKKNA